LRSLRILAHISAAGPVRYRQVPDAIGVLEALDQPKPIGRAFEVGWTDGGLAVGRLTVRGADVPGRWAIIDREFRLAEEPTENPRPQC
jgi:hypothetical protein